MLFALDQAEPVFASGSRAHSELHAERVCVIEIIEEIANRMSLDRNDPLPCLNPGPVGRASRDDFMYHHGRWSLVSRSTSISPGPIRLA